MSFFQAIESCLRKYAVFAGRAPRSEFWFWQLLQILVTGSLTVIEQGSSTTAAGPVLSIIATLVSLAFVVPAVAVGARRLHDVDRSGWWQLAALTVVGVIPLLYWSCVRGTAGPNRFGPDPLAPATPAEKPRIRRPAA